MNRTIGAFINYYSLYLIQVPDSCCISPGRYCGLRSLLSNIRYTGCIDRIQRIAGDHLIIVGAVALGIALVQVQYYVVGEYDMVNDDTDISYMYFCTTRPMLSERTRIVTHNL